MVQRHTHTFISLISDSHTKDIDYFDKMKRCSTESCNNLHIMLDIKVYRRMCTTRTYVISLTLLREQNALQQSAAINSAEAKRQWQTGAAEPEQRRKKAAACAAAEAETLFAVSWV